MMNPSIERAARPLIEACTLTLRSLEWDDPDVPFEILVTTMMCVIVFGRAVLDDDATREAVCSLVLPYVQRYLSKEWVN